MQHSLFDKIEGYRKRQVYSLKHETPAKMFSCEFCKHFLGQFFRRRLPATIAHLKHDQKQPDLLSKIWRSVCNVSVQNDFLYEVFSRHIHAISRHMDNSEYLLAIISFTA